VEPQTLTKGQMAASKRLFSNFFQKKKIFTRIPFRMNNLERKIALFPEQQLSRHRHLTLGR
jgi:DNA primase catalytic subunit